ncbi:MAG TPA: hypothetical protein ENF78_05680 [Candidatus Bathyarchaeota archaeon]|nr:hypothetical protein [Candidatus Bathyarchaeota archaeon]
MGLCSTEDSMPHVTPVRPTPNREAISHTSLPAPCPITLLAAEASLRASSGAIPGLLEATGVG